MKKLYLLSAVLIALTAVTLFTNCEEIIGDIPTNVVLTAATDTSVGVAWTAPATAPDKYIVYFKAVGAANYTNVGEVTTTSFTHNPGGATGKYYVAAKFGSDEYDSDVKSTEPIATVSKDLAELNATGNSGYGWGRTDFAGVTYSMATYNSGVDLYLTNFATGFSATPYNISSPDQGPTDPGGVVPAGTWRVNSFADPVTDPQAALPKHTTATYFNYTPLNSYPSYIPVYTTDGYYALIKIDGFSATAGTVTIETWFQAVQGLRLINH